MKLKNILNEDGAEDPKSVVRILTSLKIPNYDIKKNGTISFEWDDIQGSIFHKYAGLWDLNVDNKSYRNIELSRFHKIISKMKR